MIYLQQLREWEHGIANAALSQLSYIPNISNNRTFTSFFANLRVTNPAQTYLDLSVNRANIAPPRIMNEPTCKTCIHNLDNYCTIGNASALKHWNLPAKYGGCSEGLQFSDKLEPVDRPKEEATREPYSWAA